MTIARRLLGSLLWLVPLAPTDAWAGAPKPAPGRTGSLVIADADAGEVGEFVPQRPRAVVEDRVSQAGVARGKQVTAVAYPNVAFRVGAKASGLLTDWIAASLRADFQEKSGGIVVGPTRHEFRNARVAKIQFPALDVSSTADVFLAVELEPESTQTKAVKGAGRPDDARAAVEGFSPSNFAVTLEGLDTKGVRRVDRFTVEHDFQGSTGSAKHGGPTDTEISKLSLYVRPGEADAFVAWYEQFVVLGKNLNADEKTDTIAYYSADQRSALSARLAGVGITAIEDYVIDDEPVLKIDLYVESVALVRPQAREGVAAPGSEKRGRRRPDRRAR